MRGGAVDERMHFEWESYYCCWRGVAWGRADQAEAGLCGDSRQAVIQAMTLLTAMVLSY